MRHWLLISLFQVASTHVLGKRDSGDVTWWRGGWPQEGPGAWQHSSGGWLDHSTGGAPHPSTYKSGPPPRTSPEHRQTSPPSSLPPSYGQPHTTSTSKMAPTPPAPSPIMPTSYRAAVLHHHNIHRNNHSANAIKWDHDLTVIARDIALSCAFAHNVTAGGGGYGQNIAAGTPPEDVGQIITNEFYNGEEPYFQGLYGLAQPPMKGFEHWGHFTQVVWNNSQSVGCATVKCPKGVKNVGSNVPPYFTVCNYKPPGNFQGQYAKNVGKPLGHPTVVVPKSDSKDDSKGDSKGN